MRKIYSVFAAAAAVALASGDAFAGAQLDAIKARGTLKCGVSQPSAGFSAPDSQGVMRGIDAEICRAVAAALFGDASKVEFLATTAQQRFPALQTGEVDMLSRQTTWTFGRDTGLGFNFAPVVLYDGQGLMVKKSLNVASAKQLDGATVCVQRRSPAAAGLGDA